MRRFSDRPAVPAALLPAIAAVLTGVAAGQQELKWKFQPGDRFEIVTAQDVTTTAEVAKQSVRMSHRTVVQIGWKIDSVDSTGRAKILQGIERLMVQLKSPGADELVYDTAADKAPTGPVKQVADALEPLLQTRATLEIDARGRVGGVQLDSESDRINAPGGEPFRQFLTGEGGLELTGLRHLVLPERPVAESGRWSHASQVRLATGTFQCETTCQLTGQHTRDDRKLSKVTISWKLSPQAETAPPLPGEPERKQPMRIEKQKNEGMLLFDAAAGHPVEATFQQRMTVISQAGTSEVRQQITSNTKTTVARGSD